MTTNVEFGAFYDTGKAILGYPKEATQMRYLDHLAKTESVTVCGTLEDTLRAAVTRLGTGALRVGGDASSLYCDAGPEFLPVRWAGYGVPGMGAEFRHVHGRHGASPLPQALPRPH